MTDTVLTGNADLEVSSRRSPRVRPRGVPRWLWLLGVSLHPVGVPGPDGTRAWAVSAGIGPAGMTAVFVDPPEQD